MNVTGVGGAASLPMTHPSPSSPSGLAGATGSAGASTAGPAGLAGGSRGDLRLPGQQPLTPGESAAKAEKEPPKLAPLPPLRGLTVAEIRAMLGVAPLPGQLEAAAAGAPSSGGATSIIAAALDRYA